MNWTAIVQTVIICLTAIIVVLILTHGADGGDKD